MIPTADKLALPLPRPQYVSVPEALITALAWRVFDVELSEEENGKKIGMLFRADNRETKTLSIRSSEPKGESLSRFAASLEAEGLTTTGDAALLAEATLNSVAGVRVEKSGSQPASPITPAFALLQNMRGLQATQNPPDLAEILEWLFHIGQAEAITSVGVANLWRDAAEERMRVDPLAAALDRAVDNGLLDSPRFPRDADTRVHSAEWQGLFPDTPYTWFTGAWKTLTTPEWVAALPARVWVDWATTVLRLGLGLGYLWEASWYEAIAREILRPTRRTWSELVADVPTTVPWKSSRAGAEALDVAPLLGWRVYRGDQIRVLIASWIKDNGKVREDFRSAIGRMNADTEFVDLLVEAVGSRRRTSGGSNLWEAVKYALKSRESSGSSADYYGLLQSNGRFLTVAPGTEWIAVVGSLACIEPGGHSDVSVVLDALAEMGVRPELSDLIALLERAGMARGSADADQGVVVQSAF
jgi:hypothetical protein